MRTDEREEEHVLRVKRDAGDEVVDPTGAVLVPTISSPEPATRGRERDERAPQVDIGPEMNPGIDFCSFA